MAVRVQQLVLAGRPTCRSARNGGHVASLFKRDNQLSECSRVHLHALEQHTVRDAKFVSFTQFRDHAQAVGMERILGDVR